MGQVFRQLYYHAVWATKNREPQLFSELRCHLFTTIADKCRQLGCEVHAINGLDDHVHVVLEIPPARAVAAVIGQLKGVSAYELNQLRPGTVHWQDGYGVVSFRRSDLDAVR